MQKTKKTNRALYLRITAVLLLCLSLYTVQAQNPLNQSTQVTGASRFKHLKGRGFNLPDYDNKRLHYGFFLAFNYSTFSVLHSEVFNRNVNNPMLKNPLAAVNPIGGPGFTTGFILNARINDIWDFRILPTVSFYTRYMEMRFRNDSLSNQLNQSTYAFLELPIMVKYKSQRRHNTRMYMIGGIRPAIEVGAKREEIGDNFLRVNSADFSLEYGFGFDFYYPLFKFSPELRFSYGVSGMKYPDDNIYANSIKEFYTRTVTLYFNFE